MLYPARPVVLLILLFGAFMAAQPLQSAHGAAAGPAVKVRYIGNAQSKKYHNSSCRYFTCKNCTVVLSGPAEARKRGFAACKICGG